MNKNIFANSGDLAVSVANHIAELAADAIQHTGRFTFVLSGGSTPKKLYEILASDNYRNKIDWTRVHIFWGDERFVPFTDDKNNAKMSFETLLDHVPVQKENIHVMRTDLPASESAILYDSILREYFPDANGPTFDLVLLGMGPDGHTLSLFPGYPIIHEDEKWVDAFFLKEQDMSRITLTRSVVNQAQSVYFMVAGADKAEALQQVWSGNPNPDLYPSQVINPIHGELIWFVDQKAAGQ